MKLQKIMICMLTVSMALTVLSSACFGIKIETADEKVYGIDISRWQGEVDFDQVKADGIDFVIIRAGYTGGKDIMFETYYAAARAAGLKIGCYMYSYAESTAEALQDAKDLKGWIKGKTFDYPVYYDMEDDCQLPYTNEQRTDMAITFIEEMEKGHYLAGVYANQYWFNTKLEITRLMPYPLWLALWTADGTDSGDYSDQFGLWQYTSSGAVNGVLTKVDRNVCYLDYPAYIEKNGLNGFRELEYDPDLPFTDVKLKDWFYESVKFTYENKLIAGTSKTTFSPNIPVTRAMFVTILGRMSGEDMAEYTDSHFLDVDMNQYYGPYVTWAYEAGVVAGLSKDFFAPEDTLTREQMCRMIENYAASQGLAFSGAYTSDFKDEQEISPWALDCVKSLAGAGIVFGTGGGYFSPKGTATRAECAAIVKRIS